MAKSESTAVNALIDMVRSGNPAGSDASDDLFAAHPPRMTSTLPPAAAEVAPLPRTRAPTGTSQHVVDKQIRVTTAPPARQNTIPPLPQARGSKAPPLPNRASRPSPSPVPPARASAQAVPPPRPATQVPAQRVSQQMPAARASQQMPAVRASAPDAPQRTRAPSPDMLAAAAAQRMPRAKSPDLSAPRRTPTAPQRAQSPDPGAPRTKSPSGTQRAQSPDVARAATTDVARAATLPAPKRQTGNQRATGAQRTTPPRTSPVAAPFDAPHPMQAIADQYRMSTIDQTGDVVSAENWFEASRAVEKIDETWVGTRPAERRAAPGATAKRVLVPLVALAVVGFGVGYLVFHSAAAHKKSAPKTAHVTAPAPVAAPAPKPDQVAVATPSTESANAATATAGGSQPEPPPPSAAPVDPNLPSHPNANEVKIVSHASTEAPAAAPAAAPAPPPVPAPAASTDPVAPAGVKAIADSSPVVQEVRTAHGVVKLVDIRIDSKPSGATVMLVDNGKTTLLGTTPVAASVDPSRAYDVVLTLDGRPTQMTHFDPAKTQRLDVTLAKGAPVAKAAPSVKASAPSHAETPHRSAPKKAAPASVPAGGLADPGFDAPKAETPKAADKSEGGNGTLMVSSKPPCEIFIDGNDSGLKTPQRAMSLPAGTHKVTFSNPDANITKTVSVKITADQTTKLIQNLMGE